MLRASQVSSRQRLAQLLLDADRPCLRLFLDYHGLRVLSTWMQVKNLFSGLLSSFLQGFDTT